MYTFYGYSYEVLEKVQEDLYNIIQSHGEEGCDLDEIYSRLSSAYEDNKDLVSTLLDEMEIDEKIAIKENKYIIIGE
tara:strand:+ start:121 stop:351 length:231 start_codon:yes stop_codon:yes gene_type:complete